MESNHDNRSNQFGEATQRALKNCRRRRQQENMDPPKQAQNPAQYPEIETMPPTEVFREELFKNVVNKLDLQHRGKDDVDKIVDKLLQAHDTLRVLRGQLARIDIDDTTPSLKLAQEMVQQLRLLRDDFAVCDDLVAMAENIRGMLVSAEHLADTNAILRLANLMNSSFNYIFMPLPLPMKRQMSVPSV